MVPAFRISDVALDKMYFCPVPQQAIVDGNVLLYVGEHIKLQRDDGFVIVELRLTLYSDENHENVIARYETRTQFVLLDNADNRPIRADEPVAVDVFVGMLGLAFSTSRGVICAYSRMSAMGQFILRIVRADELLPEEKLKSLADGTVQTASTDSSSAAA